MKISVIGAGYVGLVTGGCMAALGHEVWCTDKDTEKLKVLEGGGLPIYEPGLQPVIDRAREQSRLKFCHDAAEAVIPTDAIMICVGTPPRANGEADLSAIDRVAQMIAAESQSSKLVIEKSTVPARTGQELKRALSVYGKGRGIKFRVASNPEFLREGTAVEDFLHPDRIVVGVDDTTAARQMQEMYAPLLQQSFDCPMHEPVCPERTAPSWVVTTTASAELIKHASNSFLAMKISYANMVAELAEKIGADAEQVLKAVGMDPRIGPKFLNPGLGFGGFCLPKDVLAFIHLAEQFGVDFSMLKEAEKINKRCITHFMEKIQRALWTMRGKRIALLGLAFKPKTDDIRFSPAIELAQHLIREGAHVRAYDPEAMAGIAKVVPQIECVASAYDAAEGADALVIATEWEEFRQLDWPAMRSRMVRPLILDGRNLLSKHDMNAFGFEYHSVGRPEPEVEDVSDQAA